MYMSYAINELDIDSSAVIWIENPCSIISIRILIVTIISQYDISLYWNKIKNIL